MEHQSIYGNVKQYVKSDYMHENRKARINLFASPYPASVRNPSNGRFDYPWAK
jgi:hypothetical protein